MQSKKGAPEWAPHKSVGYWLNGASRRLLRLHDERLRQIGLSMGQVPVLDALMDGRPRSQKEIAEHAGVKQPTMAEMLARMERDGVIQRSPDPDDGRASLIALTESAAERLPAARAALWRGEREATAGMSAREVAQLRGLLERVVANLEAVDDGEAPPAPPRPRASRRR
jgi:MarR family transcriptional regulator for hemolysin